MTNTQKSREDLNEMISLVNTLITESINQLNPINPPVRTLSQDQFLEQYKLHSDSLCALLDSLEAQEHEPVDAELRAARTELQALTDKLNDKKEKLREIEFWMGFSQEIANQEI